MPNGPIHDSRFTIHAHRRARGVTLLEMIVVIVITGILAGAVVAFMNRPLEGYVDAARRAELTDIADIALRRMTRDIRTALPNSIRVRQSGGAFYLEYLQTSGGGRYRAEPDSGGGDDPPRFHRARFVICCPWIRPGLHRAARGDLQPERGRAKPALRRWGGVDRQ